MRLKRQHKGMIFLVLIAIIVIAMVLSVYLYMRADSIHDRLKVDPVIKSLILVEDKGDLLFADVFLCYPESGRGALVTIPENTGGIYTSLGRIDRIDSVYKEKGLDAFKREVEKLIDMEINFTMRISLDDFQRISDLLGGLRVFIPSPIDERGDDGQIWLLPSGSVRLLGGKVRVYMTYRMEDEDDSSVRERRQVMVVALLSALKENKSVVLDKNNFEEFFIVLFHEFEQKIFCGIFRHNHYN